MKIIKSKQGSSMVELLVSFVIVLLVVGLFSTVVISSANVLKKAKATVEKNQAFDQYYYSIKSDLDSNVVYFDEPLYLEIDMDKTHPLNRAYSISIKLNDKIKLRSITSDGMTRYKVVYDK